MGEEGMSEQVVAEGRFDLKGRLLKGFEVVDEVLDRLRKEEDAEGKLAAIAEHRKHVAMLERVMATATRAEAVARFQGAVLDALDRESAAVRRRVLGAVEARLGEE